MLFLKRKGWDSNPRFDHPYLRNLCFGSLDFAADARGNGRAHGAKSPMHHHIKELLLRRRTSIADEIARRVKRRIHRKHRLTGLSLSSDVEVREAGGMSTITVTIAVTPDRGTILPTEIAE